MQLLWAIVAALLPVAVLAFYILRKDNINPEPPRYLIKAAFFGVLSALLALAFTSPFAPMDEMLPESAGTAKNSILTAFCLAAIPEEAAKLIFIFLVLWRNPFFDEHLDGIVYASFVGLGFAGFENILYLIQNFDNLIGVAIFRGLFAVPGHFFFAVVMGYFISLAHFSDNVRNRIWYYVLAYIVPVILHGCYDSLLMVSGALPEISAVLVVVFLFFCHEVFTSGRKKIAAMREQDGLAA